MNNKNRLVERKEKSQHVLFVKAIVDVSLRFHNDSKHSIFKRTKAFFHRKKKVIENDFFFMKLFFIAFAYRTNIELRAYRLWNWTNFRLEASAAVVFSASSLFLPFFLVFYIFFKPQSGAKRSNFLHFWDLLKLITLLFITTNYTFCTAWNKNRKL